MDGIERNNPPGIRWNSERLKWTWTCHLCGHDGESSALLIAADELRTHLVSGPTVTTCAGVREGVPA